MKLSKVARTNALLQSIIHLLFEAVGPVSLSDSIHTVQRLYPASISNYRDMPRRGEITAVLRSLTDFVKFNEAGDEFDAGVMFHDYVDEWFSGSDMSSLYHCEGMYDLVRFLTDQFGSQWNLTA